MLLAITGIFVSVAVFVGFVTWSMLERRLPEQRRIRALAGGGSVGSGAGGAGIVTESAGLTDSPNPALARLSRLIPKSAKDMSRLQRRLARAGYPEAKAVVVYSFAQLALPVVLGSATLLFFGWSSGLLYAVLVAAGAFTLPGFFIQRQTTLRKKAIRNGLPDALDLLTVCVEAGSGLDQAITKTTDELDIAHPALAEELRLLTTEIRAGKPRIEAFNNLAQRTGVDDVRALVAMLAQTDRFGTSIAQALRIHSDTVRTKRRQRAEERAAKVSVKMVFPLALCLFPALYIVCFGPIALKIYRAMFAGQP